jgi:hypothetical protein
MEVFMRNVKEISRFLALCLLPILLLSNISLARMSGFGGHHTSGFGGHHMSGFGGHRISGGFHHSGRFFNSRFQPFYGIPVVIGSYGYQSNDYYTYHSRYDNFPRTTDSRYDNFPYPSNNDNYRSRYDNLPYSSQAQSSPPQGNTYAYYTYNYYGGTESSTAKYGSTPYQRSTPQKSEVGIYYENGVAAFKNGDYSAAAENFQHATRQANKFMPFAYTQALFANGNYTQAAGQLRTAIDKLSPENDNILFPSFLYPSNQILLTQIEKLRRQTSSDSDLQLLVGYQLFGVKKMDEAVAFLNKAKLNSVNEPAATKLLLMIEKTRTATNS